MMIDNFIQSLKKPGVWNVEWNSILQRVNSVKKDLQTSLLLLRTYKLCIFKIMQFLTSNACKKT